MTDRDSGQIGAKADLPDPGKAKPLRIAIINPSFSPSYWGREYALPILSDDRKCSMVTGALPSLAALVQAPHQITVIDENLIDLDLSQIAEFDIVGVTGMIVQRERMFEILSMLAPLPCTVIVGGSYASVLPDAFVGLCDVVFEGEADTTFPEFIEAFATGAPIQSHYKQATPTDMTLVPKPRYDLLKKGGYYSAALQFSRGCPFRCEFCDIITIFGRRPRLKTPQQMLTELDEIRENGFDTCFLVDDNFIAHKGKAKELLVEIAKWQEQNGYPVSLSTEASLDLADEPVLLELMVKANFTSVFIGLESPRDASLEETLKFQNTRAGTTEEKIQRVRDAGLIITAGFIVGFDNDDPAIFQEQFDFIHRIAVAKAAIAILTPIPTTPLYDRLLADGRLKSFGGGLHFIPKQIAPQDLINRYNTLRQDLYEPSQYFQRLFDSITQSEGFREARRVMNNRRQTANSGPATPISSRQLRFVYKRLRRAMAASEHGQTIMDAYRQQWRKNRALDESSRLSVPDFLSACVNHWHYHRVVHGQSSDYIGYSKEVGTAAE